MSSQSRNGHARQSRGILDDFIARSALLAGLYFFVGNVFQQTYLRTFGVRVGLVEIGHLVPKFSDPIIVIYAFALWTVLTRLPDRWYNHIAELANPTTWRGRSDFLLRLLGSSVTYLLFLIANSFEIYALRYTPSSILEYVLPTSSFFSRLPTLVWCFMLCLALLGVYYRYTQVRRHQLDEIWRQRRRFMWVTFQSVLPIVLIHGLITFGFVVPSNYGVFKAELDIKRMKGTDLVRVEELVMSSPTCIPATPISSATSPDVSYYCYKFTPTVVDEVHYLGSFANNELLVVFPLNRPMSLELCIVSRTIVQSIRLARPGSLAGSYWFLWR